MEQPRDVRRQGRQCATAVLSLKIQALCHLVHSSSHHRTPQSSSSLLSRQRPLAGLPLRRPSSRHLPSRPLQPVAASLRAAVAHAMTARVAEALVLQTRAVALGTAGTSFQEYSTRVWVEVERKKTGKKDFQERLCGLHSMLASCWCKSHEPGKECLAEYLGRLMTHMRLLLI